MSTRPIVFVVSDSVGETADLVARAAISQFGGSAVEIRRFPMVDDREAVREVIEAARRQPTLIVFTIIVPEVRAEMKTLTVQYGIPAVDIMGPMLDGLTKVLGRAPKLEPGLVHKLDEDYFRRVEAVEFAVSTTTARIPGASCEQMWCCWASPGRPRLPSRCTWPTAGSRWPTCRWCRR
jgi:regulator of PEP synthase PpsR (kinase-PPPase family)